MYAKHLGKMYAKLLYGAKNTVQVLTDMQQQNTKACLLKHAFFYNRVSLKSG